ncbi:hypothetical protein AB6A40_006306 [Gnathostoma spinigerum]|uniref:G-patch domain-containing protein n=1 Tax=Gnathostoma spinigerum TaxID=75299 RepID=A0ABD6EST6_9BILA
MTYIGCEEETESIGSSKTQSEGRGVLRKPIELVSDKSGVVTIARSSSSGRRSVNGKTAFQGGNYDESGDASSECEEWERYEAHYDDVTEQDRIKPRKYEDEQEVTWEKGGPGLVWYTDDNFWREVEQGTDCDWKWADDWDVDYSEYYERGSGSMDARDAVDIRRDKMARDGRLTESVFERRSVPPKKKRCLINSDFNEEANFAVFEKYTKQIGSSIMRRHGWRPGVGLGRGNVGSVNPVSADIEEIDGFRPQNERFGVGYRGDKMQRIVCRREPVHTIYTKYDSMRVGDAVDGGESLLRRGELSYMKYRRSSKGNQ